jgi:hypothetical protein
MKFEGFQNTRPQLQHKAGFHRKNFLNFSGDFHSLEETEFFEFADSNDFEYV